MNMLRALFWIFLFVSVATIVSFAIFVIRPGLKRWMKEQEEDPNYGK